MLSARFALVKPQLRLQLFAPSARAYSALASAPALASARVFSLAKPQLARRVQLSARSYSQPARQSSYLADSTGTETYSASASWMHWVMAAGILTIVGTVKIQQNFTNAELKRRWGVTKGGLMNVHKSVALLMTVAIAPRIAIRMFSDRVRPSV
ncbi:hypothetical protein T492DRAFT_864459 [Pavlovales sp. CCMP2436]|nr:hypothetical protein T492DRAFT_864459 [Pavlovales sp. CCMP2436]